MKTSAVPSFHMPAAEETSLVTEEDEEQLTCLPATSHVIMIKRRRRPCNVEL